MIFLKIKEIIVNLPTWTKPAVAGVVVGAMVATGLGFGAGGWMTASKAEVVANEQARAEVSSALLPICLELAKTDAKRDSKIDKIRSAPSYQRIDAIMTTGWTTMPGTEDSDRRVARACVDSLLN